MGRVGNASLWSGQNRANSRVRFVGRVNEHNNHPLPGAFSAEMQCDMASTQCNPSTAPQTKINKCILSLFAHVTIRRVEAFKGKKNVFHVFFAV